MPWNGTHFSNTLCFNESVQRSGCKWSSAYVLRGDCYDRGHTRAEGLSCGDTKHSSPLCWLP